MQKTLAKVFTKIDEENFDVVETRETTTTVNHKRVNIELKTFKNNLKSDVTTIMKNENVVRLGCEKFNQVIDDLAKANEELKLDVSIMDKISFESIRQEIIDDEEAIKKQQELSKKANE